VHIIAGKLRGGSGLEGKVRGEGINCSTQG